MSRRDEEKKRRRKKRMQKRQARQPLEPPFPTGPLQEVLQDLKRHLQVPPPGHWPGASDPSLDQPDRVKFDLFTWATEQSPGREKSAAFERALKKGLLGSVPDIDHWSWEEFVYHGVPGDSWHPIDAYLLHAADRFPPAAAAQLRLWKQARISLFKIGNIADDTVRLEEWDPIRQVTVGEPFRAISLNMGGVNIFRGALGDLLLTYVAPWWPDLNLSCAMGYSSSGPAGECNELLLYLGLQHPDAASRPLPWKESRAAADRYLREWRQREWHGWFQQHVTFPFHALVPTPPVHRLKLVEVVGLMPSTPRQARDFGIYFEVPLPGKEMMLTGGTTLSPLDITSPNAMAFAEYRAYRDAVGPPPATRGAPTFWDLGRP
jgi:hypothetical protein